MKNRLLPYVLAGVGLVSGLTGCHRDSGSIKAYEGKIGDAGVILYSAGDILESDVLEVRKGDITWTYIDRDEDGIVDCFKIIEGENTSRFDVKNDEKDVFQKEMLVQATESYQTWLEAIKQKIGSELESHLQYEQE